MGDDQERPAARDGSGRPRVDVHSPIGARLAAAVIVTACAAVAKFVAGPRGAAATGVIGALIAVVLLTLLW